MSDRLHIELILKCYVLHKRDPCVHYLPPRSNRTRGIFSKIKKKSFYELINQEEGILAYNVINGTYLLGDILTDRQELDHYQHRNYENLRIPLHSTTHSQLFIRYRAIKTWNSLPGNFRSASSLSSFRIKLKLMLHQQ